MIELTTPTNFIREYCDFSDPNWVWMLVGMSRNKDNKEEASQHNTPERFMRRLVIRKPEEIAECRDELRELGNKLGTTYRIYVSLNSRDTVSALFNFQKRLVEIGQGLAKQTPDSLALSKKIHSLWKTELAQRRNRGTKRILIDIDEDDQNLFEHILQNLVDKLELKVYAAHRTVSGYAISCDAHDTRWLKLAYGKDREIDVQRDSLLFVEQWEGTRK